MCQARSVAEWSNPIGRPSPSGHAPGPPSTTVLGAIMKRRTTWLALVVGALALAASTAGASVGGPTSSAANTLTVWLQVDAQSGWPDVVAATTNQFKQDHPGWNVTVQYQTWGDHLQKF